MGKGRMTQPLDDKQIQESDLHLRARKLHAELFPEEYDFVYDSKWEASERRRGVNPVSAEYIAASDERRAQLGFRPFVVDPGATNQDTLGWVIEKLRASEEEELRAIMQGRDDGKAAAEAALKAQRSELETPEWQNQRIDEMLLSDAFLRHDEDRYDPEVVAFRVLGALFKMNPGDAGKEAFRVQIDRVLPDKTDAEYDELYRHALDKWTEVYGY